MTNLLILLKQKLRIKQLTASLNPWTVPSSMNIWIFLWAHKKPKFTDEPTKIEHYIHHQDVDAKTSPYLNL